MGGMPNIKRGLFKFGIELRKAVDRITFCIPTSFNASKSWFEYFKGALVCIMLFGISGLQGV